MNITVNGEEMTIDGVTTVEALLVSLEINLKGCAVELNREIVPKSEYGSTQISEGDRLEIIQMVGGG
jgi:thiamine biosynthesis protein ThiS